VVNTAGLVLCLEVQLVLVISAGGNVFFADMVLALVPVVLQMVLLHADVLMIVLEVPLLVSGFQVQKHLLVRHVWPS
jgi:hypothetical protein